MEYLSIYRIKYFNFFVGLIAILSILQPVASVNLNNDCVEIKESVNIYDLEGSILILPYLSVNSYINPFYLNKFICTGKPLINGYTGANNDQTEKIRKFIEDTDFSTDSYLKRLNSQNIGLLIIDKNIISQDEKIYLPINSKETDNYIIIEVNGENGQIS